MTTILVVDDSAVDRTLTSRLLKNESGWNIVEATNGVEAIAAVNLAEPDVIVTDMLMPEMNGLEMIAALRKDRSHIPVILMTSRGSEEIAINALQAGASSYVPKRSLSSMLVETVRRVLASMQEHRMHAEMMGRLCERVETFELENNVHLLMALSRHLQNLLVDVWGMDRSDRLRIGTALEEALLNAMYHGNLDVRSELKEQDHQVFYNLVEERRLTSPWGDRRIHVQFQINVRDAMFVIRDEGAGFDLSTLPDPTDPANLAKPFGRGVMLMKAFMDDVTYNPTGNEVTLRRRRYRDLVPPETSE